MSETETSIYDLFLQNKENQKLLEKLSKEEQEQIHNFLKTLFNKAEEIYIKPLKDVTKNNI